MAWKERHQALVNSVAFIKLDAKGELNYWCPERSGVWDQDCATGRRGAIALTEYLYKSQDFRIMMPIMAAMGASGMEEEGVETGFLTALSELYVRGLYS